MPKSWDNRPTSSPKSFKTVETMGFAKFEKGLLKPAQFASAFEEG
jgi:hypothetical protein